MSKKHYGWKRGGSLPQIGAHSLAKHRIVKRYLERYIEIVTATSNQEQLNITFVDGYAGGGRYQLGNQIVPGSPLIILETVAEMQEKLNASRHKGFRINSEFIFIDKNSNHTDFLRAEIEGSSFKGALDKSIHIITADFNERVPDLIKAVQIRSPKAGRAIFLLDQYGWSQVSFQSIRSILCQLDKAEVFLTFSVDALIDYLSENSYNLKAFGEIDVDPVFVRELTRIKEEEQVGYRALIQNGLYNHVQMATKAAFYSPFFIKSPGAHRSYWFIHLSRHREARNEIGKIHWAENNTTTHHGSAGLNALGFSIGKNPEQFTMEYLFDDHAKLLSRNTLHEQLPRLIHNAVSAGHASSLEELFGLRCNDTPVVREMFEDVLVSLRDHKEILLVDENGRSRPRTKTVNWTDRALLSPQPSFFGPFSQIHRIKKD